MDHSRIALKLLPDSGDGNLSDFFIDI